jgi:hypothetical protein
MAKTKSFGDIDERVKVALGKAVIPDATLVVFAASPGRKAAAFLKDSDTNSPFTKFLSNQLAEGVGNLRDLVEAAARETETQTGRRQVPYVKWEGAASAVREIVFRQARESVPTPSTPPFRLGSTYLRNLIAHRASLYLEANKKWDTGNTMSMVDGCNDVTEGMKLVYKDILKITLGSAPVGSKQPSESIDDTIKTMARTVYDDYYRRLANGSDGTAGKVDSADEVMKMTQDMVADLVRQHTDKNSFELWIKEWEKAGQ